MNIIFLSLSNIDLNQHSIYGDLLKEFLAEGHSVYAVSALQRRSGGKTYLTDDGNFKNLRVHTGNITKTNLIEKGISTLLIEHQFKNAVKKYFKNVHFDLILYPTPPITFIGTVSYIKKRDGAKAYLMLKDIFPQNAVDIGMMTKSGVKGLIYRHFRKQEKKLYEVSDVIGCMSQANVDYVLKHNPELDPAKVEILPNTIEAQPLSSTEEEKNAVRKKYGVPTDKKVFIYGGNLGRPQGVPFLMQALKACEDHPEAFFLIVGDGTEYKKLEAFFAEEKLSNALLLKRLPKEDYDILALSADVGMIFLDHRFTIPNFPSRLLSYMQAGVPALACTDPNTDVGKVITEGGFGWWCESCDTVAFRKEVDKACQSDLVAMGKMGRDYLLQNYTSKNAYDIIVKNMGESETVNV